MKFATSKEHRDFFHKQGWIEFEEFISNDQVILANQAIDQALAERLHVTPERLHLLTSEQIYLQGRDLWRLNPFLRKFVTQTRFAEIASELIEKKVLRLGYDQLLPARYEKQFSNSNSKIYSHFLEQPSNLETVSCLQGVLCGLIVALGGKEEIRSEVTSYPSPEGIPIFPSRPGHVIFFQSTIPIQWNQLYQQHPGQRFYLIVYTQALAHYYLQPQDPHTHFLKRIGYIFNDKLIDKHHPIVFR